MTNTALAAPAAPTPATSSTAGAAPRATSGQLAAAMLPVAAGAANDPEHEWPEFIAYRNLLHHAATFWHNALEREWEDVGGFLGDQLPKVLAHHVLPAADALARTRRPCPGSAWIAMAVPMPCKQVIVGSHDLPVQRASSSPSRRTCVSEAPVRIRRGWQPGRFAGPGRAVRRARSPRRCTGRRQRIGTPVDPQHADDGKLVPGRRCRAGRSRPSNAVLLPPPSLPLPYFTVAAIWATLSDVCCQTVEVTTQLLPCPGPPVRDGPCLRSARSSSANDPRAR